MTKTPRSHKRKPPLDPTETNTIRHREPLLPEDPAVGIKFACAFLNRHKITVLRQLNPKLPEYDAELAACAYRESEASPWKFIASRLYALRERLYACSQERNRRSSEAGAE
jgi:hypothetical protein